MNARRLLKLADYLQGVPPGRFDMVFYANGTFCQRKGDERKHKCGTAACAMGWATTMPEFKKLGLGLDCEDMFPVFRGETGFRAAGKFFGTDCYEAIQLFDYRGDETPKQVARRIRQFVARKQRARKRGGMK